MSEKEPFAPNLSKEWAEEVNWKKEVYKYPGIQDWSEKPTWKLGEETKKWANALTDKEVDGRKYEWKKIEKMEATDGEF